MASRLTSLDRWLLERARFRQSSDRVPVLVGGCGSGRTERLRRLHEGLGQRASQYVDLECVSTTPERCYLTVVRQSPFSQPGTTSCPGSAREAFDALLSFLMNASAADGTRATFLLDEMLEVRTFESFPGLRSALGELARAVAHSPNAFVLATRFTARAQRWVQTVPERFDLTVLEPLGPADARDAFGAVGTTETDDVVETVNTLVGGRPAYVRALLGQVKAMQSHAAGDPISALAAALAGDGELAARCRFSYELRLHRARGYGALKAILDVLGEEEPLTLTHIAQRLGRTAGSTKDYLSWLQDVDLVTCHQKRYTVADPIMRLWMRIHRGPAPADEERIATEVQTYSLSKLRAQMAAVPVGAGARASAADRSRTGIIEID